MLIHDPQKYRAWIHGMTDLQIIMHTLVRLIPTDGPRSIDPSDGLTNELSDEPYNNELRYELACRAEKRCVEKRDAGTAEERVP